MCQQISFDNAFVKACEYSDYTCMVEGEYTEGVSPTIYGMSILTKELRKRVEYIINNESIYSGEVTSSIALMSSEVGEWNAFYYLYFRSYGSINGGDVCVDTFIGGSGDEVEVGFKIAFIGSTAQMRLYIMDIHTPFLWSHLGCE